MNVRRTCTHAHTHITLSISNAYTGPPFPLFFMSLFFQLNHYHPSLINAATWRDPMKESKSSILQTKFFSSCAYGYFLRNFYVSTSGTFKWV
ncbi:hypothetical protein LI328DRAFT_22762 [Trichoderma asperelloides]|nr:hypothetical protein LI328DRAFT_22762 [Trichoderma asperelloides]